MIKNHRAILGSDIGTLPIHGRWVVVRPEHFQKLLITDLRRIEFHFHHFSVAAFIGANVFIRRIVLCSSRVPDGGTQHAVQIAESFFHSPETAGPECGFLTLHAMIMMLLPAARNRPCRHSLLDLPSLIVSIALKSNSGPKPQLALLEALT